MFAEDPKRLSGYQSFAASLQITHVEIKPKQAPTANSSAYHIQHTNSLHQLYKTFIRPFSRPARKYLEDSICRRIAQSSKRDTVKVFRALWEFTKGRPPQTFIS